MEYFKQNKQRQRAGERFVMIIYSLYTVNLCIGIARKGCAAWVPALMLALAAAGWILFLREYNTYRIRAALTAGMIYLTLILYAMHTDDPAAGVPAFMVLTLVVALYGFIRLLWFAVASLLFLMFYHIVIAHTITGLSGDRRLLLLVQTGNLVCMGIVICFRIKKQDEDKNEFYKIIDALVEAEQSRDDFLANISHEIRTPVNTICGMSELALREKDAEKIRDNIFDIRDAGRSLMLLVSDILDFAQLQQGKMELEEEAYNITSTINDVIHTAMARKGDKKIELIVSCDADIPCQLFGDEKKIRKVITNLVDNAIKFTNEGCVCILVSVRKEKYGINLCVSVKDTGIGMSEESLEKLFESFSQVDARRSRQAGGMGLGLAISRALTLKMGGTITIRSRLGKGSVVRFVVPQKVLREEGIARVENGDLLHVAVYINMEQFHMNFIRDEFAGSISHMAGQLRVKCHMCRNLAELKRRQSHDGFSHIFISLLEYLEDETYFNDLAKRICVVAVIDRPDETFITDAAVMRLYKPFYILPAVAVLNGGREGSRQMIRPGRFTAPDVHALVVDDNLMNIRVIDGLLKEYRIRVTYTTSGADALRAVENMCYDLILMDHMMPEMDGIETMRRIREMAGLYFRSVPIIALTANAGPGSREMFLEAGFDDFLEKPVQISVLERVLQRNLPAEKVLHQPGTETEAPAVREAEEIPAIGDLHTAQGIAYCGGRRQYLDILEACRDRAGDDRAELERLFAKEDWENYVIRVHALKSTMYSIGASALADRAKALEMAGKKKDTDVILRGHAGLMAEYDRVTDILQQCPLLSAAGGVSGENMQSAEGPDVSLMPALDEETFDNLLRRLEEGAFSLDGGEMLAALSSLEQYRYGRTKLSDRTGPIRKKIEMADYMSALDAVLRIWDDLKKQEGESGE